MFVLLVIKMTGERVCKSLESTLSKAEEVRHWLGGETVYFSDFSCFVLSCFVLPDHLMDHNSMG